MQRPDEEYVMRCPNRTICCELFVRKGERESMRDYKKAVLGMTLALSMVVTGSSLDGITAKKQRLNCLPAS